MNTDLKSRRDQVTATLSTSRMEGLEPDEVTREILMRYASGDITLEEMSARLDAHAARLVTDVFQVVA